MNANVMWLVLWGGGLIANWWRLWLEIETSLYISYGSTVEPPNNGHASWDINSCSLFRGYLLLGCFGQKALYLCCMSH